MLTLYQFPISHYCEKVRWALDYKRLDYQTKNLLPGLHASQAKKLAPGTSLPILLHNGQAVQGSSRIISHLDLHFPEHSLTPEDASLKEEALEWEHYADTTVGPQVRSCCYHVLLNHPDIVIPFFSHQGPWYGPLLLRCIFPILRSRMRELMNLNADTAEQARKELITAADKLHTQLSHQPFLVGKQFTRADLAAASLLAPLCKPRQYGLSWPEHYPDPLEALISELSPKIGWVGSLYQRFRP